MNEGKRMVSENWHLDKRVPIALILAMAGQVAVAAWGAAVMFKDIEANRAGLHALDARIGAVEGNANDQAVQLGRIEESIRGMRGDIGRLLNLLERRYQP